MHNSTGDPRLRTAITRVRRPLLTQAPDPNQNATGIRHRPEEQTR